MADGRNTDNPALKSECRLTADARSARQFLDEVNASKETFQQRIAKRECGIRNLPMDTSEPIKDQSLLEYTVDIASSKVIGNEEKRDGFNQGTGQFLKTASLFSRGNAGLVSAVILNGMDKVRMNGGVLNGCIDFTLGGIKGGLMREMYTATSKNFKFAPTKGILMGMGSRAGEIGLDRSVIQNPTASLEQIKRETMNPSLWAFDGATFALGEGLFAGANKFSGGRLVKNELASGMSMGASFGIVNGGSNEIIRQTAAKENLDWGKVLYAAGKHGGLDALAAGAGIKGSDPRFYSSIRNSVGNLDVTAKSVLVASGLKRDPNRREFQITGEKQGLVDFANARVPETTTTVREIKRVLFVPTKGAEQTMIIRHGSETGSKPVSTVALLDGPAGKTQAGTHQPEVGKSIAKPTQPGTLLATCFPESLPAGERNSHVFPDANGRVWLDMNVAKAKLAVLTGDNPATSGYKPKGTLIELGRSTPHITMNVMAPLAVGDLANWRDPSRKWEWDEFERDLANAKKIGVDGVSTDIWWGLVEPRIGRYNWDYYDHLSDRVLDHGLHWVPIMSYHKAGGNVGDNINQPIPNYVWNYVARKAGSTNPDYGKYVSEQRKPSDEIVSAFVTPLVLPRYTRVMMSFQDHFAAKRAGIPEINISLGPAGEIRYPSYNSHDVGTGYPNRGGLQAYSEPALKSFRDAMYKKYGDEAGIRKAWGELDKIEPPQDVDGFFRDQKHTNTQYGRDFFDWYNQTLIDHGNLVLGAALDVFAGTDAPFRGVDIGAKVPGVHWRVGTRDGNNVVIGDRLAELTAGVIRTSGNDWNSDALGRGYRPLISMFNQVQRPSSPSRVVPHFTALELPDGHEGPAVKSLPFTLAGWVGAEAARQGLSIKGENALAWTLQDQQSWDRMRSHLALSGDGKYHGLTLLRMHDALASDVGRGQLADIIATIRAQSNLSEAK